MKKDNTVYLEDIRKAILRIEKYINQVGFEEFEADLIRQDAIIRRLEIIGEAANKLTSDFKKHNPEFPVSSAVRMRNFLIHGYSDIDLSIVWQTIKKDLPLLKQALAKINKKF